jgi:cell division protein FtsZ
MDLAIDEVTTISTIIQEAAGEEAEIIFGAVHDPTMKEEVRVTVIATGFDKAEHSRDNVLRPNFGELRRAVGSDVPSMGRGPMRPTAQKQALTATPIRAAETHIVKTRMPRDLEIPTFIRRQVD